MRKELPAAANVWHLTCCFLGDLISRASSYDFPMPAGCALAMRAHRAAKNSLRNACVVDACKHASLVRVVVENVVFNQFATALPQGATGT